MAKIAKKHVTAVIPAYNEEKTVGQVIEVLQKSRLIDSIVVINDGSSDRTADVVRQYMVKFVNFKENKGKSQAVKEVCSGLKTDIIFFCDADLVNFTPEYADEIIFPVLENRAAMSVGLRHYGAVGNVLQKMLPIISGERAIEYSAFCEIMESPLFYDWGMEVVMNYYCDINNLRTSLKVFRYGNIWKPQKFDQGGLLYLVKEFSQVAYIWFLLRIK